MPQLTAKDIRKLTPTERKKKLDELYNELSSIRIELTTGGGTENPYKTCSQESNCSNLDC
jgi:ribosomal protein L29